MIKHISTCVFDVCRLKKGWSTNWISETFFSPQSFKDIFMCISSWNMRNNNNKKCFSWKVNNIQLSDQISESTWTTIKPLQVNLIWPLNARPTAQCFCAYIRTAIAWSVKRPLNESHFTTLALGSPLTCVSWKPKDVSWSGFPENLDSLFTS